MNDKLCSEINRVIHLTSTIKDNLNSTKTEEQVKMKINIIDKYH